MHALAYTPPATPARIVYQDDYLLAVDKPGGLLSVPGRGPDKQDCLLSRLQSQFSDLRMVHRLDMATSGLILFARDALTQSALGKLFEQREIHKQYLAIVHGLLQTNEGQIHAPLICDWPNRPRQKIDAIHGKPASTSYQVLHRYKMENQTRVMLSPLTGRSHQLRVHMTSIGHPVVGDPLYGQGVPENTVHERLHLHASALQFIHPVSHQPVQLECPAPF